jgi:lipoprotein Spr
MASCGSSKKNVKTAQLSPIENVDKRNHSSKNHNETPTAVANALVLEARSWIGTPYKYGGHSREGADCSGFLMEVFKSAVDVNIPRTTKDQRSHCLEVDRDHISVGDIIFFSSNNSSGKIAHVGMYVGDGRMIHASSSRGVVEDNLDLKYYVEHFRSIGRVPELAAANPVPQKSKPAPTPASTPVKQTPKTTVAPQKTAITDTVSADTIGSIVKNAFKK